MQGLFTLLILSMVMAIASFLAGILPLSFSLSRSQLRLISTIGMGVLVGTSLIIIIPEGVDTIYTSNMETHHSVKRYTTSYISEMERTYYIPDTRHPRFSSNRLYSRDIPNSEIFNTPGLAIPDSVQDPPKTPTDPGNIGILGGDDTSDHTKEAEHTGETHHAWIGVALIAGFVLMFLIDKLPQTFSSPAPKAKTHSIALNNIGRRFNLSNSPIQEEEEGEGFLEAGPTPASPKRGSATTIGLVIHAAADGIALGASSSTSHTDLSLVIFFAIMIHKAPAAFGLTSILLRQGLSKRMVRTHLVLFSLAAPVGALVTWMIARILGSGTTGAGGHSTWWTGVLLLFSAGTFLYVAMHSMQEVMGGRHDRNEVNGHANGSLERRDSSDMHSSQEEQKPSLRDVGAAVFGMILPLFLQVGHAH